MLLRIGTEALRLEREVARVLHLLLRKLPLADVAQDHHPAEDRAVVGPDRAREGFDPHLARHGRPAQNELSVVDRLALHRAGERPLLQRDGRRAAGRQEVISAAAWLR